MNTETIQKLIKCVKIIEGYGHFKEGQDGHRALEILEEELLKELTLKNPLGFCPHCDQPICKEARAVEDAVTCLTGHIIPKSAVRKY